MDFVVTFTLETFATVVNGHKDEKLNFEFRKGCYQGKRKQTILNFW